MIPITDKDQADNYPPSGLKLKIAVMLLGITLLVDSPPCSARAYRCTDANGNISYSQTPCSAGQTGARMHGVGTSKITDREACSLVRGFAAESFAKLRQGTEPSLLIDKYGGPGYINPLTLNVINFVSGFRLSEDIPVMKVSGLAYNKCINGGFGKLERSSLPVEMLPSEDPTPQMANPGQFPHTTPTNAR
jgi:hypothetical protein